MPSAATVCQSKVAKRLVAAAAAAAPHLVGGHRVRVPVVMGALVRTAATELGALHFDDAKFEVKALPQLALDASFRAWQPAPVAADDEKAKLLQRLRRRSGTAAYLRFDTRRIAVFRARLRLDRSHVRDSLLRRKAGGVTSNALRRSAARRR